MDESLRPGTSNIDLPHEIQRPIFEVAARNHRGAGFNLIQVAGYVYTWIEPILYERIEILSPSAASALLTQTRTKNREFLDSRVRQLALSSAVDLKHTKDILAATSRNLVSFSAWGTVANPTQYLPFIRSPYLRRLALISSPAVPAAPRGYPDSAFDIPREMLSSLTHILVVSNIPWIPWPDLTRALGALDTVANPAAAAAAIHTTLSSPAVFQNLTHFAVPHEYWSAAKDIGKVARNLRYVAILKQFDSENHGSFLYMVRSHRDRRFVVMNMERFVDWPQGDSQRVTAFWREVEGLVSACFISDQLDIWPSGRCYIM